jgi:poly(A) polymerase
MHPLALPASCPAEHAADSVIAVLKERGFAAYRVGGCVRDRLVGRTPKDVDVATDAVPAAVREAFPRSFAVGESFGVVVVHAAPGMDVEVATFRADGEYADGRHPASVRFSDMASDAARRDFTVNGLFYDPDRQVVHDYVGGLADIRRGVVRAIGEADRRFGEDRLRMLRAVRFSADLAFALQDGTLAAVRRHAARIVEVSCERILVELGKMLCGNGPGKAVRLLRETSLLPALLPEVEAMLGVEQPEQFHPAGDVWEHTVNMLEQMRWRDPALAWGVLLHDVGKPPCQRHDGTRYRFNGHDRCGADMADAILARLKASKKLRTTVGELVGGHMAFMNAQDMRVSTFRRFVSRESFALEMELHRLDCAGSHRKFDHYVYILDRLAELASEPAIPAPLVSGRDLLRMGLEPGPLVGRILAAVQEQQLEGAVGTREDALELARRLRGVWQ